MLGLGIVCLVSAAAWVYLVAAHGGFWLTSQRLPRISGAAAGDGTSRAGGARPSVAAVVPARNEAESLPVTLPTLLAQDYPGEFRVFLVDDNSDDGTGAIAAEIGEKAARDGGAPLTVVKGRPRPDGWAGKVWAMAQGLAAVAGGETSLVAGPPDYVLFTDADIGWAPHALRDLVQGAEGRPFGQLCAAGAVRAAPHRQRMREGGREATSRSE